MYTYHYKTSRYYKRHRTYEMADGTQMNVLTTRYTYKMFYKPCKGPRGGKGRKECARSIYYARGMFWQACNHKREDGTYYNSVRPFSGHMWDIHGEQSEQQGIPVVSIWCADGVAYAVDMDGERIDIAPGEWESMYTAVLDLPEPEQPEPTTTTDEMVEQPEQSEIVAAAAEIVEAEAARVAWIESTTTAGQQINLFAYAGYAGDTAWQELAYVGGK